MDAQAVPHVPAIRAHLMQSTHERLRVLLELGVLCADAVEVRLEALDLGVLECKLEPLSWIPTGVAGRLDALLLDTLSRSEEPLMRELGGDAATRLLSAPPLDALGSGALGAGPEALGRLLAMTCDTLNFGLWHVRGVSVSDFTLELGEVGSLCDSTRFAIAGLIEAAARRVAAVRVESLRPERERLVFHTVQAQSV